MTTTTRALTAMLAAIAAGILLQAVLAGIFISGTANARLAHTIVGWILPLAAIAPAVTAFVRTAPRLPQPVRVGCALLPVGLWIQEMLGHVPAAATTAIHVPLGVLLFGAAAALALAVARSSEP